MISPCIRPHLERLKLMTQLTKMAGNAMEELFKDAKEALSFKAQMLTSICIIVLSACSIFVRIAMTAMETITSIYSKE